MVHKFLEAKDTCPDDEPLVVRGRHNKWTMPAESKIKNVLWDREWIETALQLEFLKAAKNDPNPPESCLNLIV